MIEETPLLFLFNQLREAGVPLGLDEYYLLLESLQAGFGLPDKEALARLCKVLWVKSADDLHLFNYHFDQLINEWHSQEKLSNEQELLQSLIRDSTSPSLSDVKSVENKQSLLASEPTGDKARTNISHEGSDDKIPGATPKPLDKSQASINTTNSKGELESQEQAATSRLDEKTNLPDQSPATPTDPASKAESPNSPLVTTNIRAMMPAPAQDAGSPRHATLLSKEGPKKPEEPLIDIQSKLQDPSLLSVNTLLQTGGSEGLPGSVSMEMQNRHSSLLTPEVTLQVEDEIQVAKAVLQTTSERNLLSPFILSNEYFPVTMRQMKRSWRYLRRAVREGTPTELSIEATMNRIGHEGDFADLVFVPRRTNSSELLLLIDHDGSMVPFHILSRRLAETAERGGQLRKASICYFHNCPQTYLYRDIFHQHPETLASVFSKLRSSHTGVLIFSDAGAARGGFNIERVGLTRDFVNQLKQHIRYIAWLNPMPKSRWRGTTAESIAQFIPMFELSRSGLDNAIRVLLGRMAYGTK